MAHDKLLGQNLGQGAFETSSDPVRGGDDKWARWFGTPPYSSFQRDNYSDLVRIFYMIDFFSFFLTIIFV